MSLKLHLKITLSLIIRNERVSDTFIILFLWSVLFCVFLFMQAPVVVDPKSLSEGIDLLSANDHLTHSEVSTFLVTI